MTRREQIKNAYKLTGGHAGFYDGMMTYSTLPGKAICRIVWNMDGEKNLRYLEKALSGIPEDFSGKLLEVPVGTGVLTMPVYRELPDADKEVLLVLDGTTGQNGLIQAKQFKEIAGVTAIALTKLDGTAKGGIVIAVADSLQIPVKFVGVGEQADDLMPFVARDFVDALI
jgi:hypothetical protein